MVLELLTTVAGGIFSGGATGLLGVIIQRYFDKKSKDQDIELAKLSHANALALADKEQESARIRADAEKHISDNTVTVSENEMDAKLYEASVDNDSVKYLTPKAQLTKGFVGKFSIVLMSIVDFVRGILRPGMTAYLCYIVTMMFFWVKELAESYGLSLTPDQVMQLMIMVIGTITYVFTTCALWWFGARPPKKNG